MLALLAYRSNPVNLHLRVLINGEVVSSPKRWPPLLGFFGPHHFLVVKQEIKIRVYFIRLRKLVVIANPMVPS